MKKWQKFKRRKKSSTTKCVKLKSKSWFSISVQEKVVISSQKQPKCWKIWHNKNQSNQKQDSLLEVSQSKEMKRSQFMWQSEVNKLSLFFITLSRSRSTNLERRTSLLKVRFFILFLPFFAYVFFMLAWYYISILFPNYKWLFLIYLFYQFNFLFIF